MRSGLEVLLDDPGRLSGQRVGLVCNHTAVDRELQHAIDLLRAKKVELVRLFAPEHGVRATAQDMEHVGETRDPVSGLPVVSLYGDSAATLKPNPEHLRDLDVILFDIQDIGARYYTFQATLGFVMEVAGPLGVRVVVLDRPNPIDGVTVEGNLVSPGFASFVGAYPIAQRHGMTVGELARYFQFFCAVKADVEVIRCEGWKRGQWFDETDLPWVYPSPNMPTLDTATVYPGTCLIEAMTWSEGRGTTRPFHLVGAPGVDPEKLAATCAAGAEAAGLRGVKFRPAAFIPGFQKHAKAACTGIEIHVRDRKALDATLLGLVVVEACYKAEPERFGWRTEPYEFIADVPAIDLLTGNAGFRTALQHGIPCRELYASWAPERTEFLKRREECLLYGA